MEFEPSYAYLISSLSQVGGEEEATKLLEEAIRSSRLQKQSKYEIDDFLKICEELKKKEGRIKVIGLNGITQARCYRTLQGMARVTKATTKAL
jgi:hypothetical protein